MQPVGINTPQPHVSSSHLIPKLDGFINGSSAAQQSFDQLAHTVLEAPDRPNAPSPLQQEDESSLLPADWRTIDQFDWSQLFAPSWDRSEAELTPAGEQMRQKIVQSWRNAFVDNQVCEISRACTITTQSSPKSVAISKCQQCGFIVDAVELIRMHCGAMYDGSTLDQLRKKIEVLKLKCPKCRGSGGGQLGDIMLGFANVPCTFGGTMEEASGEEQTVPDPTLYKVAPNRFGQQQITDQLQETLPPSLTTCEDTVVPEQETTTATTEVVEQDKEEEVVVTRQFLRGTARMDYRQVIQYMTKLHETGYNRVDGIAQVAPVFHSQIGQRFASPLSCLYYSRAPLEMSISRVVDATTATQNTKLLALLQQSTAHFATHHDQYVGNKGRTFYGTNVANITDKLTRDIQFMLGGFDKPLALMETLLRCQQYVHSIVDIGSSNNSVVDASSAATTNLLVIRQALPCEVSRNIPGSKTTEHSTTWLIETNPTCIANAPKAFVLFQVVATWSRGAGSVIHCTCYAEHLMHMVLSHSLKTNMTHSWVDLLPVVRPSCIDTSKKVRSTTTTT